MFSQFSFIRKTFLLFLTMTLVLTAYRPSLAAEEEIFEYRDNGDGTITITDYVGTESEVTIPHQLGGKDVTSIGEDAFSYNELTSVTLPDSVVSIEKTAFAENQLTSVTLPDSIVSIGQAAFQRNQLTSVTFPDSIKSIGEGSFQGNQLTSVTFPNSVERIGNYAFTSNQLTSVTLSESVEAIGEAVFAGNQLTSVIIPDSVKSIGSASFINNQLTSVTIPKSVETIGEGAFSSNPLSEVIIHALKIKIHERAFYQLTNLVIYGHEESTVKAYAKLHGITFGAFEDAFDSITIAYAPGDDANHVTQDVGLPERVNAEVVIWSSSNEEVIASDGTVNRPDHTTGNIDVTLTATIMEGPAKGTRTFLLTVLREEPTDEETLSEALNALAIVYSAGDEASSVTSDVTLAEQGLHGTTVEWESSNEALIASDGTVSRPHYTAENAKVTLTATLTKGAFAAKKTFELTVVRAVQTEEEAFTEALNALAIGYATGDEASSVTSDVTLAEQGLHGTTVKWESNNEAVIASDGKVTRPHYTAENAKVTLTATLTKGAFAAKKTFELTVVRAVQTEEEAFTEAMNALAIGYATGDEADSVTSDVTLVEQGLHGTTVKWESNNEAAIASDGKVTRPHYTAENAKVTLTATLTKGAFAAKKTFELTVVRAVQTEEEAFTEALNALAIGYATGDEASSVTSDVTLIEQGLHGTTVKWESNNEAAIASDGKVTRPHYTAENAKVTLTATLTKGAFAAKKTFELTVVRAVQTEEEAFTEALNALAIGYATGDEADSVTSDVTLVEQGLHGTTVKWESNNEAAIASDGKVTRPHYTAENAKVTLTATLTKGAFAAKKTFELTVVRAVQTEEEAFAEALNALAIGYVPGDSAGSVTKEVTLVKQGLHGTTVKWESNNEAVIASDGTVDRPHYTAENAKVTLTATLTKEAFAAKKTFALTVLADSRPNRSSEEEDEKEDDERKSQTNQWSIDLKVNGKADRGLAEMKQVKTDDGRLLLVISLTDEDKLKKRLEASTSPKIDLSTDSWLWENMDGAPWDDVDGLRLESSYALAEWLGEHKVDLALGNSLGELELNYAAFNLRIDSLHEKGYDPTDFMLGIQLSRASSEDRQALQSALTALPGERIGPPIEVLVTATDGEKIETIRPWDGYSKISIHQEDIHSISTAVRLNGMDDVDGVPTVTDETKKQAVFRAREPGIYGLISYSPVFRDVEQRWSEDVVEDMAARLIVDGVTDMKFDPKRDVTRAEVAAMIARSLGVIGSYSQLSEDVWYQEALEAVGEKSLMVGDPDGSFRPNDTLSRQEAAVILNRVQRMIGESLELSGAEVENHLSRWSDHAEIAPWAEVALAEVYKHGILLGDTTGTVRPRDSVTREEMTAILHRMLERAGWIGSL
ncbi:immunoglobulin-like domain-containing protein [Aureibacillus halotolerans]|uniref:S-layer family protein n=1 Tax=Aureibacillus halotolerans TaxID=1508390 RepID=A0A4R6U7I1_9BACI|nr:immunoglobulin-like domain-containing protein [Aureibacillus halotolerans]TDQ40689.1 S-layer family protein [Aureibacillus halotolerans]